MHIAQRRAMSLFVIFLISEPLIFCPNPTYSLVGLKDRKQTAIRYTERQAERLAAAAEFRGLPMQSFQLQAVIDAIEETEADMKAGKGKRQSGGQHSKSTGAVGLGLFQNRTPEPAPVERPQVAPPPVVVNVGADRSSDSLVERLAKRILEAPSHERDRRKREAVAAIQTLATDEDEQRSLIEKLNTELSRKSEHKGESLLDKLTGGGLSKWTNGIFG